MFSSGRLRRSYATDFVTFQWMKLSSIRPRMVKSTRRRYNTIILRLVYFAQLNEGGIILVQLATMHCGGFFAVRFACGEEYPPSRAVCVSIRVALSGLIGWSCGT